MSIKPYLCLIYGKRVKSINRLIKHLNVCKSHLYPKPQPLHEPPQHKFHNKKDALGGNWKDEGDLLGKTVTTATVNGILKTPTEDTPWKRPFANESLLVLKKRWFNSYKFLAGTLISDEKYKYPGSKHKNSFYSFND